MSEKPEEGDDFEGLETLEKNFQKVLSEIMADKSLDAFRAEYERIYDALVQSHEYNAELVRRVKSMNAEIVANSQKVNSVLKMSQDDQRTIAGLRFEFEKAWKMVELSEEKEGRSKDIIEELKGEVANLTRIVETDGARVFGQDLSMEGLQNEIAQIKREMGMQDEQLQQIQKNLEDTRNERDAAATRTTDLGTENEDLEKEIADQRTAGKSIDEECREMMKQIVDIKQYCKDAQDEIEEYAKRRAKQKEENFELADLESTEKGAIKESIEENKAQQMRIKLVAKLLEDKKEQNEKTLEAIENAKKAIEDTATKKVELGNEFAEFKRESDELNEEMNLLKAERSELAEAISSTKKQIVDMRNEMFKLTHDLIRKESEILASTKGVDSLEKKKSKARKDVTEEKKHRQAVVDQRTDIQNDMMAIKAAAHKQRQAIEHLKRETERYSHATSDGRSNANALNCEKKFKETENTKLTKELQATKKRIDRQQMMTDTAMQQRDFVLNQVKVMEEECVKVEENNKLVATELKKMKELIREKDQECLETHIKKENMERQLEKLGPEVESWEKKLKEAIQEVCTLENRLMKARYLDEVAVSDLQGLRRDNKRIESEKTTMEAVVHKKLKECEILREKSAILSATISAEGDAYTVMAKKVEALMQDLQIELDKMQGLRMKGHHKDMLRLEVIRVEKQKLQAQGRVRALEEELEKPMGIHRWRFLENTNPEVFQMIKMTHALRNKYMVKMTTLQRFQELLKETEKEAEKCHRRLGTTTCEENEDAKKFYTKVLREKTRQIATLSTRISGQQAFIDESKQSVEMLKTQIRDAKGLYYTEKRASDDLRAKSQLSRVSDDRKIQISETRFVGGGFGVAATIQRPPIRRLADSPTKSTVGGSQLPSVVVPKVASSGKTSKLLPGWNPSRRPLQPFLPTVT